MHIDYQPDIFRTTFWSPYDQYADLNGQRFRVLRPLVAGEEFDPEPHGTGQGINHMYLIRFEGGNTLHAWGEEVCVNTVDGVLVPDVVEA